jgi:predicted dehydrogenase
MREMRDVRLIRVHDFAADFSAHLPLFDLVTAEDVPPGYPVERQPAIEAALREALGSSHADLMGLYAMLLMLGSHDLAILRGAFGPPGGVLYSNAVAENEILSVLDYGPGRRCVVEVGIGSELLWWDEQLTAYGRDTIVEIGFANPFVPYAPTTVTIRTNEDGSPVRKEIEVSHREAFRCEWEHFHDCVRDGSPPRTSLADARADVELAIEMVRAIAV